MNIDPDHLKNGNLKNGQPDEALLTAYALGELNRAEQVVVEASLAGSPDAQRRVEEIRTLAADLWEAARRDPLPEASDALREAIEKSFKERGETEEVRAMETKPEPPSVDAKRPYRSRRYLIALAAAASLLMAAIPGYRLFFPGGIRLADQDVAMTSPQGESPAMQMGDVPEGEVSLKYGDFPPTSLPAGEPASGRAPGYTTYATDDVTDEAGADGVSRVATAGDSTMGMSVPGVFSADLDIPFSADSFGLDSPQDGGFSYQAGELPSKPALSEAQPPASSRGQTTTHGTPRRARPAPEGVTTESWDMPSAPRRPSPTGSTSLATTENRPTLNVLAPGPGVNGPEPGLASESARSAGPSLKTRVGPIDTYYYHAEREAPKPNSRDGMEVGEKMAEMEFDQKLAPIGSGLAIVAPTGPAPVIRGKTTFTLTKPSSGGNVQNERTRGDRAEIAADGAGGAYSGMGSGMMGGYGGMMGGGMGGGGRGRAAAEDAIMDDMEEYGGMGMGMGGGMGGGGSLRRRQQGQPANSASRGLPGPYGNPLVPYVPQQGLARKPRGEAEGQSRSLDGKEVEVLAERLDVLISGFVDRRLPELRSSLETLGTELYDPITENEFLAVDQKHAKSTFSVDVDTASYANVRRFLNEGRFPPPNAVRIEELVNYFQYDYPLPEDEVPFSVDVEMAQCPWTPGHRLARIGIKGQEIHVLERGPSNLVFLLDVSGSMSDANKLPLVKQAMTMLVDQLTEDDRVAIVTYAGSAGVALEPTRADKPEKIRRAIEALSAGGSTHGSAGIVMAYDSAMRHYLPEGINRVILCTDGDLNVGITDDDQLVQLITRQAKSGVFLTVLGFGTGNLKDSKMEKLADKGNGIYAYVDSLREARRLLVEQVSGSLVTIAKDVKIQIEFNPAEVAAYRLIGYENRVMAAKDFANDKKDAGEIGAGHTVTALYEIVPAGGEVADVIATDRHLKYQRRTNKKAELTKAARSGEIFTLALRYKLPEEETSRLLEYIAKDAGHRFGQASADFRFASAVAAFGMLVRGSQYAGDLTFSAVEEFAAGATGNDPGGYRSEFVDLVRRARQLRPR